MLETLTPDIAVARRRRMRPALALLAVALGAAACSPTVRIIPPEEPIRIDLAVNIQQDVRITVSER